jgi:hypothetical protein
MKIKSDKTYIGVVEDNKDPRKMGRVRVRVMDVFDEFKLEDIPWARPWKDISGDMFNVPEVGKVVVVVFENSNIDSPEYIYSRQYNINLEKKLSTLSDPDYLSMKSLIFNHKTQIYVNDLEGLKLDYKLNVINIKDKSINLNLKDNFGKVNIGSENADQRAILGDNFLNWFDELLNIIIGDRGGAFIGNSGYPVITSPAMMSCIFKYFDMKNPKFLSKNVYLVDNDEVKRLNRISEAQIGDTWRSTVRENTITTKESIDFNSVDGPSDTTFDQYPENEPIQGTNSTTTDYNFPIEKENPKVEIIKEILSLKNYKLNEEVNKLNIISVRNQCLNIGDKYTNQFVDKLYVMFKDDSEKWNIRNYIFSTVPGTEFTVSENWLFDKKLNTNSNFTPLVGKKTYMKEYIKLLDKSSQNIIFKNGLPILAPSQYVDSFFISNYRGYKSLDIINGSFLLIWRDSDYDKTDIFSPNNFDLPEETKIEDGNHLNMGIHVGFPGGISVGNWSEGSSVFSNKSDLDDFFNLCETHKDLYGNSFTYTLITKKDWDTVESYIK